MKKHYTLYNIGKLLILSCVLLLGEPRWRWGSGLTHNLIRRSRKKTYQHW